MIDNRDRERPEIQLYGLSPALDLSPVLVAGRTLVRIRDLRRLILLRHHHGMGA